LREIARERKREIERHFIVYKELRRHHDMALPPVRERDATACIRRHQALALTPVRERETLPRV
jgi:hypothetical protein